MSPLGTDGLFLVYPLSAMNITTGDCSNDSLFMTWFVEIKPEASYLFTPLDVLLDLAIKPFEFKHPDLIHPSIEIPSSPQPSMSTFMPIESNEGTMPTSSSSEKASNDPVPTPSPPLPMKATRRCKQPKGIKCGMFNLKRCSRIVGDCREFCRSIMSGIPDK